MDGLCHESPRWVSLLVAEIFYPEAHFPNQVPAASSLSIDYATPQTSKYQLHNSNQVHPSNDYSAFSHHSPMSSGGGQKAGRWRAEDGLSAHEIDQEPSAATEARAIYDNRFGRSKITAHIEEGQQHANRLESRQGSSESGQGGQGGQGGGDVKEREDCDGFDKVGCYVIRVYYDWFLVPGSCKCWKKNTQGSLDAIKKIFIGK